MPQKKKDAAVRVSKTTGLPVDRKRSLAAKKAAATRRANLEAASQTRQLRLHHKLLAGGAVLAVLVFAFIGIKGQLDAFAATTASGTFTGLSGKCMDNDHSVAESKNPVQLWKCNGTNAQKWTLTSDGSIQSTNGSGKFCLDVPLNSANEFAYLRIYTCNGTAAQKFSVKDGAIIHKTTGYCVTVRYSDSANGTRLWMIKCAKPLSKAQKWAYAAGVTVDTPTTQPVTPSDPGTTTPTPTPADPTYGDSNGNCNSSDPGVVECSEDGPGDTTSGNDDSYNTGTGGDSGGASTGSGRQQTGNGLTLYQNLSGSTFNARINAAGSGKTVSLPSGTYSFSDFKIGDQGVKKGMSAYGARLGVKGIVGAGVGKTIVQMTPKTSTKAKSQPASCGGGDGCPTNNLYLLAMTAPGATFDGITLKGTNQGHYYGGLLFARMSNPTLSNAKFTDIPGGSSANPDETFFVNFHRTSGKATIKNVSINGGSVGAAGIATNTCSSSFEIDNLYVDGLKYSAGIATWEQTGTMNIRNWTNINAPRALGAERLGGTINLYDPKWESRSNHDITYTPYSGHQGRINFYYSSASKVPKKKVAILTNTKSVVSTVHVYVAGKEQPQGQYIQWRGSYK